MESNKFLSSDERIFESELFSDVTVKCGGREWKLHKIILCSRSAWFKKALTGSFQEAETSVVKIKDFDPEPVHWALRYLYSGRCDVRELKNHGNADQETTFVIYYQIYTVADYLLMKELADIALDSLDKEFTAKLPHLQLAYDLASDWLPDYFEVIRLIYADVALPEKVTQMSPIRRAFVRFTHAARFFFLQNKDFNRFTDEEAPVLALDLFRAMRECGDFIAGKPDQCMVCKVKLTTRQERHFSHLAPQIIKLNACCQTCATRQGYGSNMTDWSSKTQRGAM